MSQRALGRPRRPAAGLDRVFATTATRSSDFEFNQDVAQVFDDMLVRSVPFYKELQYMVQELARTFHPAGSRVYDLGCSTGTTLINLSRTLGARASAYIGYDNSAAMLDKAKEKIAQQKLAVPIRLELADLLGRPPIRDAGIVTMCWTLQFIRPPQRQDLVRHIAEGMRPDGALLVIDKVLNEAASTNRAFIDLYYEFKRRNGYSAQEIAKKREALENVLIPYRIDENLAMFRRSGFRVAETFFQWYNFAGFVCLKQPGSGAE